MKILNLKNKAIDLGATKVEIWEGIAYFVKGANTVKEEAIELDDFDFGYYSENGIKIDYSDFRDMVENTNEKCFSVKDCDGQINLVIKSNIRIL